MSTQPDQEPAPRIPPLPPDEWTGEVAELLGGDTGGPFPPLASLNIFPTLARNPGLFRSWLPFGGHLLSRRATLSPRDRELLILRTAVRCGSSYEWGQHVRLAQGLGIDRATIDRVVAGPGAPGWDEADATLIRAADELHDTSTISDPTWEALAGRYDDAQLIELCMLVGHYHLVAYALNACGVPLDEGTEALPDPAHNDQ